MNAKDTPDEFLSHYLPFRNHWSERFLTICSSVRVFGLQLQRRHGFVELAREQNRGERHGEQICDRLIFLHQGEILYDGSLPAFQNACGGHYTIALESAAPLSIRLPGLRIASQEGCKYVLESDRRDVNPEEALYHLTSQNVPIRSLQVQESSIESILIALMNKP